MSDSIGGLASGERAVANSYREDIDRFARDILPLLQERQGSLFDNNMVEASLEDTARLPQRTEEADARTASRYGLGYSSANQRDAVKRTSERDVKTTVAGAQNNARINQRDRNDNLARGLATLSSQYRQQGLDEMMQAVGLGNQRESSNAQARSTARQQNLGTAASLATTAILAF